MSQCCTNALPCIRQLPLRGNVRPQQKSPAPPKIRAPTSMPPRTTLSPNTSLTCRDVHTSCSVLAEMNTSRRAWMPSVVLLCQKSTRHVYRCNCGDYAKVVADILGIGMHIGVGRGTQRTIFEHVIQRDPTVDKDFITCFSESLQ